MGSYPRKPPNVAWTPSLMMSAAGDRPLFPPRVRTQIERMACTDLVAYGRRLTHWDCRSLAQGVVTQEIVASIHHATMARILAGASLQPHRSRYWKTAKIDQQFMALAAKILWCHERVERLYRRGELVICMDEKPNIQALTRGAPPQPMQSGPIERQEFEYKRHGTITFLVAFNVYDGKIWGCCPEANDHEHFLWAVRRVERRYPKARRIHLIMDNGPSHIDHHTKAYFTAHPRIRALYTPTHGSRPALDKVYDGGPLISPHGRGRMRIIRRIKDPAVTQRVLKHPGLWHVLVPAAPAAALHALTERCNSPRGLVPPLRSAAARPLVTKSRALLSTRRSSRRGAWLQAYMGP